MTLSVEVIFAIPDQIESVGSKIEVYQSECFVASEDVVWFWAADWGDACPVSPVAVPWGGRFRPVLGSKYWD